VTDDDDDDCPEGCDDVGCGRTCLGLGWRLQSHVPKAAVRFSELLEYFPQAIHRTTSQKTLGLIFVASNCFCNLIAFLLLFLLKLNYIKTLD